MPNISYTLVGDYFLPNICLRDPPDADPLTKYGLMRKSYLKNHRKISYGLMLTREEFYPHCRDVQRQAQERMTELMEQLTQRHPPPEKAVCGLAWAQHMAGLHHTAEEYVLAEIIYA